MFDHCAQLIDTLCKKGLNPTVLVLQTDCGLNYSLKGTSFQLVLMFVFNELDLNHFVTLRCASNGSARNIVEHSMSILNLPLGHVALKRGNIPDWAETEVNNCSTMKSVRNVAVAVEKRQIAGP